VRVHAAGARSLISSMRSASPHVAKPMRRLPRIGSSDASSNSACSPSFTVRRLARSDTASVTGSLPSRGIGARSLM
jgi:hypothetical protein